MPGRAWLRFLLSVVSLVFASTPLFAAQLLLFDGCPADTVAGRSSSSSTATYTQSNVIASFSGTYNLVAATLSGHAASVVDAAITLVAATDEYIVTGPPTGTPLLFAVEFTVNGSSTGPASCRMRASTDHEYNHLPSVFTSGPNLSSVLRLPILVAPDTPFRVRYSLGALLGGNGVSMSVTESGTFRFSGLPAGAKVRSCQGFQQDITVAAATPSWGSLKIRYR